MGYRKKEVSERKKYLRLKGMLRSLFVDETMTDKDWKIVESAVQKFQTSTVKIEKDHLVFIMSIVRDHEKSQFVEKTKMSIRTIFAMLAVIHIVESSNVINDREFKKLGKDYQLRSIYDGSKGSEFKSVNIVKNIGMCEEEITAIVKKIVALFAQEEDIDHYSIDSVISMSAEFKEKIDTVKQENSASIKKVDKLIESIIEKSRELYFSEDGDYLYSIFPERQDFYDNLFSPLDFEKIMITYKA